MKKKSTIVYFVIVHISLLALLVNQKLDLFYVYPFINQIDFEEVFRQCYQTLSLLFIGLFIITTILNLSFSTVDVEDEDLVKFRQFNLIFKNIKVEPLILVFLLLDFIIFVLLDLIRLSVLTLILTLSYVLLFNFLIHLYEKSKEFFRL